ncbi:hypothetical protein A3J90_04365 [candidate division WOR-1 bacterium RIFOXYC2_FULL_37_10]|uniref:histidine kinase n=1 Tax=candidate division WOR-1 bacterium RIFOXYB2_FULL_37_13 TaxID=1802579 RepID=A0A1F4SF54_UNCSA|nr:MAG: hypothetical protein A2310_05225 [candidate division WOR-1 bacterium RIFOXYB2_FULL_37_13]OGC35026.1 MAG: hypothetical protein A3J90_04365 [candidate division WOR-1 bacterium RIFOXYC2_FULL_37_10]
MNGQPNTDIAQRIIWLIKIRFLIILSILVIVFSAHLLGMQFQFPFIYILLFFAFIYNFLFYYIGKQFPFYLTTTLYNYLRIFTDLLITTILVHFSGGVDSPFNVLYFIDLATTALFFGSSLGILMSGHAIIFYSLNNFLEALKVIPHYQIAVLPNIIYSDPGYFMLKSFSLFFIALALIYTMSYLSMKIHEKQEEVEKLSADKINFMNMVAHELRSPLTSIEEYVSLALEGLTGPLTPDQTKALTVIKKQSKRINDMVNDLLDLAHIETKMNKFETYNLPLVNIIEKAVCEVSPQITANNLSLEKQISDKLPNIPGNEENLLEVMINILSNAIKFSNPQGKIKISAEQIEDKVYVAVKDNGIGISPGDIDHIFEKFYRTSSKESARRKGTGLGMALSRSIIEKHGGRMWAESEGIGKGATLMFTLPVK